MVIKMLDNIVFRDLTQDEVVGMQAYWDIGRIIVEHEQDGNVKAQYGANLLLEWS
jgi:hypothetical protein